MKTQAELERDKAEMTLPALINFLNEHPERHTPFMDRWATLCILHGTQVYPVKRPDGAVGRRLMHGNPPRIIELIESCARFGKKNIYFAKLVG